MDKALHRERTAGRGTARFKPTFNTTFGSIPNGVMFHQGEDDPVALLKWESGTWVWAPGGYVEGPN